MKTSKSFTTDIETLFSFFIVLLLFLRALHNALVSAPEPSGLGLLFVLVNNVIGAGTGIAINKFITSKNASISSGRRVTTCIIIILSLFSHVDMINLVVIASCSCCLMMFMQSAHEVHVSLNTQARGAKSGWRTSLITVAAAILTISFWVQASSGSTITLFRVPWIALITIPALISILLVMLRESKGASPGIHPDAKKQGSNTDASRPDFDSSAIPQVISAFCMPIMFCMVLSAFEEINHATVDPGTEWASYLTILSVTTCLLIGAIFLRPHSLPLPLQTKLSRWIAFWAIIGIVMLWWAPYLLSTGASVFRTSPKMNAMIHVSAIYLLALLLVPTARRVTRSTPSGATKIRVMVAFTAGTCCSIIFYDWFFISYRELVVPSIVASLVCVCVLAWYKSNSLSPPLDAKPARYDILDEKTIKMSSALGTRFLTLTGAILLAIMSLALVNVRLNTLPFPADSWFLFIVPLAFLVPACLVFSVTARNAISKLLARGPVMALVIILVATTWFLPYLLASKNLHGTGASISPALAIIIHVIPTIFFPCLVAILVIFSTGFNFRYKNCAGIVLTGFFGLLLGTAGWQISLFNYEDMFGPSAGFLVLLFCLMGTWFEARRRIIGMKRETDKDMHQGGETSDN